MISVLTIYPIISATVAGILGSFYILLYRRKREYTIYVKFAFACYLAMAYAISSIGYYSSGSFSDALLWRRVQTTALSLFTLQYLNFIIAYINQRNTVFLRLIQIACVITIILQLTISGDMSWKGTSGSITTLSAFGQIASYVNISPGIIANILFGLGIVIYFYIFSVTFRYRKLIPDRKKAYIYSSVFIFYLGFLNDMFVSFGLLKSIYLLSPAVMILVGLTGYSMIDTVLEDASLKKKLEITNKQLEQLTMEMDDRVKRRTEELRRTNATLEEKLEEINLLQVNLRDMAIHDPLTGLYNRHLFDEILSHEFSLMKRGHKSCLVMIDIDHFKDLNDRFGHRSGDMFLKKISSLITSSFRESDYVFRYGGEEFLVVMPNTDVDDALKRVEELREKIWQAEIDSEGRGLKATISAGVSQMLQMDDSAEYALRRADNALYAAKVNGRNRVERR